MKTTLPILAALTVLSGCASAPMSPAATQAATSAAAQTANADTPSQQAAVKLSALYAAFWQEQLKRNPLRATQIGDARYNDVLVDSGTQAFRDADKAMLARYVADADAIGSAQLTPADRLSFEIGRASCRERVLMPV